MRDARTALADALAGGSELVAELRERLGADPPPSSLGDWLVEAAGPGDERRAALADALGAAARRLAPEGEAWRALVTALDRLYGSGAHPLGRLPFVSDRLLGLLVEEARTQIPERAGERRAGAPGEVLANLAVSRNLREAVSAAVGFAVVPTYSASYLYEPPGSHVRTHVDRRDYEVVFHLVLEHERPAGGAPGSALVVHRPDEPGPGRLELRPGEAVALRGRGTLHSWEPLAPDERRVLLAAGFERAPGAQ